MYGVPAEISEYLIPHPIIRKISFTGSTAIGKQLAAIAGAHMKRVTMELGGHAPAIVFDDADVDTASRLLAGAKYRNAGQVCVSPTRVLVQERVYNQFVEGFVKHSKALKVGDGLDSGTTMGPMANARRIAAMEMFIGDAQQHGAKVQAGGHRIGNKGNFFEPTVITDVPKDARVMNEEPFGPLAVISPFSSFDEVVTEANRVPCRAVRRHGAYALGEDCERDRRGGRERDDLDQPSRAGAAGSAVRRHQGLWLRVGRRARGDRELSQYQVRHPGGLEDHRRQAVSASTLPAPAGRS